MQAAVENAAISGELPHQFLLRIMRGDKIGTETPSLATRIDAAKAAGPYYAPRLISHEVSGKGGGAIQLGVHSSVVYYKPESTRRVVPADPSNDAVALPAAAVKAA